MRFFNVVTKVDDNGNPVSIGFPYGEDTYKVRLLAEKDFYAVGQMSQASLFGKEKFNPGSSRAITITEGELDALSVYQMLGYPVVSVRGASSARQDCARAFDYLNSFEKIYLCFDNDEAGQRAVEAVAPLFDFNKVYQVKMSTHKDANEFLEAGEIKEFKNVWWGAKRFLPTGIVSTFAEIEEILKKKPKPLSVDVPFKVLQEKTKGLRVGEILLMKAQEGIGKTELIRAFEYHALKNTDLNIGIIHVEEDEARLFQGLAGLELKQPVHLNESAVSPGDVASALRGVLKRDERVHVYTYQDNDDPELILDRIRFMVVACGCRFIFLDHMSDLVSGQEENHDERKKLDYIATKLAHMVKDLQFGLVVISHVNDDGKSRGSRYIQKKAHTILNLTRDTENENPILRNTTYLTLSKNRTVSKTGPAGRLFFDEETWTLSEQTGELPV